MGIEPGQKNRVSWNQTFKMRKISIVVANRVGGGGYSIRAVASPKRGSSTSHGK